MNRRSFLLGASSLVAATALPVPTTFKQGGTITGRFTSNVPNWHELSRHDMKMWMWGRRYGMGNNKLRSQVEHLAHLSDVDLSEIEARVFALSHDIAERGGDPYDPVAYAV